MFQIRIAIIASTIILSTMTANADQIKVDNQITSVLEKETNIEDIYINKEIKEEVVEINNIQRAVEKKHKVHSRDLNHELTL